MGVGVFNCIGLTGLKVTSTDDSLLQHAFARPAWRQSALRNKATIVAAITFLSARRDLGFISIPHSFR